MHRSAAGLRCDGGVRFDSSSAAAFFAAASASSAARRSARRFARRSAFAAASASAASARPPPPPPPASRAHAARLPACRRSAFAAAAASASSRVGRAAAARSARAGERGFGSGRHAGSSSRRVLVPAGATSSPSSYFTWQWRVASFTFTTRPGTTAGRRPPNLQPEAHRPLRLLERRPPFLGRRPRNTHGSVSEGSAPPLPPPSVRHASVTHLECARAVEPAAEVLEGIKGYVCFLRRLHPCKVAVLAVFPAIDDR